MITKLEKYAEKVGYRVFRNNNKSYNLNIWHVRNNNGKPNKFDDLQCIWYYDRYGHRFDYIYPITTDPGKYWLKNPINVNGTAIICPGQYLNFWKLGMHKGYLALVQKGVCDVWRDNNKDEIINMSTNTFKDVTGANCHHSGVNDFEDKDVDKWSACCQVHEKFFNYVHFIELCKKGALLWGNSFSFTLVNEQVIDKI